MKWLIIILMGIMFVNVSFAEDGTIETYKPNEVFTLPIHLTNITGEVIGASCSTSISYQNYTIKEILSMNEIGNGYYNATYNTSQQGFYFCSQNCTLGTQYTSGSCDFIIQGDQMVMGIIILIPIFIMFLLFGIAWFLPSDKYPSLKIGLVLLSFIFVFQAYQFAVISLSSDTNSLIDSIGQNVENFTWVYVIFFSIILITFIYDIFMLFSNKKHKTGDYDEE